MTYPAPGRTSREYIRSGLQFATSPAHDPSHYPPDVISANCQTSSLYCPGKMCHGHPHYHKCQHTSVKWLYCPEAAFDLETGYEAPCSNPIYSTPQPSSADCPLQNCHYKTLRGSWTCCQCGYDTNSQGWCNGKSHDPRLGRPWAPMGLEPAAWQTCGHGCCGKCTRNSEILPPLFSYAGIELITSA
jgi:hypothetical protein